MRTAISGRKTTFTLNQILGPSHKEVKGEKGRTNTDASSGGPNPALSRRHD